MASSLRFTYTVLHTGNLDSPFPRRLGIAVISNRKDRVLPRLARLDGHSGTGLAGKSGAEERHCAKFVIYKWSGSGYRTKPWRGPNALVNEFYCRVVAQTSSQRLARRKIERRVRLAVAVRGIADSGNNIARRGGPRGHLINKLPPIRC